MPFKLEALGALTLSALLLGTTFAHVLEISPKRQFDAPTWMMLQQNLYRGFATVGGAVEIAAILAATALAFVVRGQQPPFAWAAFGCLCLAAAFFGVWIFMTRPVNAQVLTWTAQSIPPEWTELRARWDLSHLLRFVLHLVGFAALSMATTGFRIQG